MTPRTRVQAPIRARHPQASIWWASITGYVTDNNNGTHGFVRSPSGQFNEFDAPGADPVVGCTCPVSINDFGAVAGQSIDANSVSHGFLRSPDGKITVFDVSEAGVAPGQGTVPSNNNDFGVIAGNYVDANGVAHGFLRIPNGNITTFDPEREPRHISE